MIFGHVLEERSVIGSQEAIDALGRLTRSQARRVQADGSVQEVDNANLRTGDLVEVRAGDRVPADGVVVSGQASLDTAPITGESVPQEASVGMQVFGGAINLDGLLRLEVTRTGEESTLGKVIALMQSAERAKPPITRLLERYAGSYLVLVLLLAAVTWFITNDAQAMLAVLVAACPCALVLSAPATAIAGIAVAARHGILIRSSAFLEELADLTSLVVDKTGTLTFGTLRLQAVDTAQEDRRALLSLAASLGAASSHPVSRALAALVPPEQQWALEDIHERQGLGVVARTDEGQAALGRPELFASLISIPARFRTMMGRLPGWRSMVSSSVGCCWPIASSPKPPRPCKSCASWGWGANCCSPVTGKAWRTAWRERWASAISRPRPCRKTSSSGCWGDRQGFRPMVVGDGINDSLALKAGVVGSPWGRAARTSPWPRPTWC